MSQVFTKWKWIRIRYNNQS